MFNFKTVPYEHQLEVLNLSYSRIFFALFMDMGTGKSKVIIDTANQLYAEGLLDAVVVLAPNGVHVNWVRNEIPAHTPDDLQYVAGYYKANGKKADKEQWNKVFTEEGLRWFCFNIETASNPKGQAALRTCVAGSRTLFVIDESQRFKTPGAKRTQFVIRLGRMAAFRRVLSGTPLTESPLDLYAQMKFLSATITGHTTNSSFKARYAITETRKMKNKAGKEVYFEQVTGYKNIHELERNIAPHCFRVTKADCLDLPDKIYETVYVDMTREQSRIYKELLDRSVAILKETISIDIPPELKDAPADQLLLFYADSKISTKNAMVKLLRLQQVLTGSLPDDEKKLQIIDSNRLKILMELLSDINGKVIIWARFRYDLDLIANAIIKEYGADSLAQFHGGINTGERTEGVDRFQKDDTCRFFLAQQHSGGTGITLTAAATVIYYSNDFSLEARMQSEDRAHRIGQKNNVTYIDLVVADTVDEKILASLATKRKMAESFDYSGNTQAHSEEFHTIQDELNVNREALAITEKGIYGSFIKEEDGFDYE